uniref:Uncharacterized protein n=1 Tax=Knipowitschia caucasica TaxID=637954 RepID=A0AAV2LJ57_KNICA
MTATRARAMRCSDLRLRELASCGRDESPERREAPGTVRRWMSALSDERWQTRPCVEGDTRESPPRGKRDNQHASYRDTPDL